MSSALFRSDPQVKFDALILMLLVGSPVQLGGGLHRPPPTTRLPVELKVAATTMSTLVLPTQYSDLLFMIILPNFFYSTC